MRIPAQTDVPSLLHQPDQPQRTSRPPAQSLLLLWDIRNHLWRPQPSDLCMQQGGAQHSLHHKLQHLAQLHSISPLLFPPLRDFILWARPLLEPGAALTAWPCLRHSTHLVFHPSSQVLFPCAPRASRAAPLHSHITIHPISDKPQF